MRKHLLCVAAALGLVSTPVAAAEIGVMAAVNERMDGTPPERTTRQLFFGDDVFQNELIETSPNGLGQALFLDQTSLTIAPNSRIVLDSYVYDPDRGSGDLALSLTRGALRFVGGRISKTRDATIRTPTATVGIRGGIATIETTDDGVRAIFIAGDHMVIESGGDTLVVSRPGGVVVIRPDAVGGVPKIAYAGTVTPEILAQVNALFTSSGSGLLLSPGTSGSFTGIATLLQQFAAVNSQVPGTMQWGPISTKGEFTDRQEWEEEEIDLSPIQEIIQALIEERSSSSNF